MTTIQEEMGEGNLERTVGKTEVELRAMRKWKEDRGPTNTRKNFLIA